jgi:hypothetical protein
VGIYGGHDNSTQHPELDSCVKTIDFMFEYVDMYMSTKINGLKYVVINLYGGEALHHPNIVEILEQVRKKHQPYQDRWSLTITTTTNAVVTNKKIQAIAPFIDEFTVSYHSELSTKQKQQFFDNLLTIKSLGKRVKCVVLMHGDPVLFDDSLSTINWLKKNEIKHLPRQLDHHPVSTEFNYTQHQVVWFEKLYNTRSHNISVELPTVLKNNTVNLTAEGRSCCGGRLMCEDKNYKDKASFVKNKFTDWYCSVNHFFLYIKQVNGEIYVNKDCKMNFQGEIAPIGHLSDTDSLLKYTRDLLDSPEPKVIQCAKSICLCGLCAPKSNDLDNYRAIMKKYQRK